MIVLRDIHDEDGVRHLEARFNDAGDLVIEGQDLGDGVERFFGAGIREYEWIWTIRRASLAALGRALGVAEGEILAALGRRFSHPKCVELEPFLKEHEIALERWSRLGD